ncbi:unnamed protein product [Coffea canephora]|uniref:Chalcone-flavonone isomerase family protein n=1 Tax=Coffea canephora TaxID=49390 RepID=A0A068TVS6_COFCA|nr:unnamed protein product [Coffea canephora]
MAQSPSVSEVRVEDHELNESIEFFRDIVTGPSEKFARLNLLQPLTGQEFSKKVAENCTAYLK